MSDSQRMIQPNPDEPCQWCGATEHKQPIIYYGQKECPHCGGTHFGSYYCPYSETQIEKEEPMIGRNEYTEADMVPSRQMPLYNCHKQVWALKIAAIEREKLPVFSGATCKGSYALGSACGNCERCTWERERGPKMRTFITPADEGFAPFQVEDAYLDKHRPHVGGYYVVYKDGYKSFSPAKAFEEGYTRV